MQTRQLGSLSVSAIGLGCMGMSDLYGPTNEVTNLRVLNLALDIGINFFDTADMYGVGANERLLAKVLQTRRDEVRIETQSLWASGNRVVDLTCCPMDYSEVMQVARIFRPESHGLAHKFDCSPVVPGLMRDEPQKMQGFGVIGVFGQYLVVQGLGLAQTATLVILLCGLQERFDLESVCAR